MKTQAEKQQAIRTLLSFALIPLSGFATDIYLPSLPSMAGELGVSNTAVQLSLVCFIVSYGISQLFVGSLLDSFGRYRLNIGALAAFAVSCFAIAITHNIYLIYGMRIIQGIAVALIVVGKRAYFVDTYSGDKLKHYTSLFSIIWATAPIAAPFLGGYLQVAFGWESNFYFLGILTLIILTLELIFGGESLKHFHQFRLKSIVSVYANTLRTADFTLGLVILGLCYGMLIVFGMAGPFIIEHVFNYSPVVTGYSSLLSGIALMTGGVISKAFIRTALQKKVTAAIIVQFVVAMSMIVSVNLLTNLYTMMGMVFVIHLCGGFMFNSYFSYSLGRFTEHAGMTSGITGGATYIVTSVLSYSLIHTMDIDSQSMLGEGYLIINLLIAAAFLLFIKARRKADHKPFSTEKPVSTSLHKGRRTSVPQ